MAVVLSLFCKDSVGEHLHLDFFFHPVITQVVQIVKNGGISRCSKKKAGYVVAQWVNC